MPVDIVATNAAPYTVQQDQTEISSHSTLHKALQSAVNTAEQCQCLVFVNRALEYRVEFITNTVKLSWQAPTQRAQGEDLPPDQIGGYRVKTISVNGERVDDVGNALNYNVRGLVSGVYEFLIATYDTTGQHSEYSSPVQVTID